LTTTEKGGGLNNKQVPPCNKIGIEKRDCKKGCSGPAEEYRGKSTILFRCEPEIHEERYGPEPRGGGNDERLNKERGEEKRIDESKAQSRVLFKKQKGADRS